MVKFSNRSSGAKSKRVPLRLKHKVETRVKEHNKKMKKEARKMKALGIIRKSKKKN
jgi:nuclear GTP-binding protein